MNQISKSSIKVIGAVSTIACSAQIAIDIGSIPITGQTLAILIWAFFLSFRASFVALTLYVILGIIGAPVFADGASGLEKLYGGSGGYLIGFIIAACLVSYLFHRFKSSAFITIINLTALGTLIILFFGTGRLIQLYGFENGVEYGLFPFWKGAIIKVLLGSLLVWGIKRYIQKNDTSSNQAIEVS